MGYEEKALMMVEIEDGAFESRRDGCVVSIVTCRGCKRLFEDELEEAKAKVLAGIDLLCLDCDEDATAPSFSGITVQIGWHS